MAGIIKEGLLQVKWQPAVQFVRFRKVNVQKPRPPSYQKAKLIEVCKPFYPLAQKKMLQYPDPLRCKKMMEGVKVKDDIVNPYEVLLAKDLNNWFNHSKLVGIFHANTMCGEDRSKIDMAFKKENMYFKKRARTTVAMALKDTPYEPIMTLFISHTVLVFSAEPNVAKMLKLSKKMPSIILMAGIVEGRYMNYNQMVEYSQLGDLTTARAQLVALLNSAQTQLVSDLIYHQKSLVSGLQQYATEDKGKEPPESSG